MAAIPPTEGALVTEIGNYQDFLVTPIFVVCHRLLFFVSSSVTKTRWSVYLEWSQTAFILPQKYSIWNRISWCENVCQMCGCVRVVGAGLMQVYIANASPFGY